MSTVKDYLSLPIRSFLEDLAEKTPTPGGGSVAAMAGAMAAGLAAMVAAYSLGRRESAARKADLEKWHSESRATAEAMTQLVAEDIAAYQKLVAARREGDPAELKRAMHRAIAVPMELIALAGAVCARCDELKAVSNPHLDPDLHGAVELATAAARIAAGNVRANLAELKDAKYAGRLENQLDLLLSRLVRHRNNVTHYQRGS